MMGGPVPSRETEARPAGRGVATPTARWVVLLWLVGVVGPGSAAAADLKEIAAAYEAHRRALDSILVECQVRGQAVADEGVLYKSLGIVNPPRSDTTTVMKGPKVYVRALEMMRDQAKYAATLARTGKNVRDVPVGQLLKDLDALPLKKSEVFMVFDGSLLWQKGSINFLDQPRDTYQIAPITKAPYRTIPITYLDQVCYGPVDPTVDTPRLAAHNRLPDLFEVASFLVSPTAAEVDGAACVMVESLGFQRLWLDPKLGFAVRKREVLDGKDVGLVMRYAEFAELVPGVWLPHRIDHETVGTALVPEPYRGKPLVRSVYRVTKIEANKPEHEAYFVVKPAPGSFVTDSRLKPLGRDLKPIPTDQPTAVGYIQPASDAELDKVMHDAELEAGRRIAASKSSRWKNVAFLAVNALVFLVAVALVARRYLRRPKATPES